jgi:hypothetical protein
VFLRISTHITTTPGIPPPSPCLQPAHLDGPSPVKRGAFTAYASDRLRALYAQ